MKSINKDDVVRPNLAYKNLKDDFGARQSPLFGQFGICISNSSQTIFYHAVYERRITFPALIEFKTIRIKTG
jgi:hypothetical protein